jgi:hypothetical protein
MFVKLEVVPTMITVMDMTFILFLRKHEELYLTSYLTPSLSDFMPMLLVHLNLISSSSQGSKLEFLVDLPNLADHPFSLCACIIVQDAYEAAHVPA